MAEHTEMGRKIIASLEQAIAFERGEYEPARIHRVPITAHNTAVAEPPRYDAARIQAVRRRLAVSQQVFAAALNVSPGTVRAWEQGRRVPEGPTLRLLEMAEEHPEFFAEKVTPSSS